MVSVSLPASEADLIIVDSGRMGGLRKAAQVLLLVGLLGSARAQQTSASGRKMPSPSFSLSLINI